MKACEKFLKGIELPSVAKVEQKFSSQKIEDVARAVAEGLQSNSPDIVPGSRIAITCGSRGIDQYVTLVKAVADFVKSKGANPVLIPSMGSHGGATAEGQIGVLKQFGVTEESIGAPILSSMETVQIGETDKGLPVYIDKNAKECDGIILLNRVKPHTSFRGTYESGLVKMLGIGLAKHKGCEQTHLLRFENMAENLVKVGTIAINNLNIMCGVATIENGYGKIAQVHVLKKSEILTKEPELLKQAWDLMPRIYLDEMDVLIVSKIGKEISGTGMDTNIIGRFHTKAAQGSPGPNTIKLGVLDVTDASNGNANGMGLADFIPRRFFDKIDFDYSYINSLTSTEPFSSRIPMILNNDRQVLQACVKLCGQIDLSNVRMVLIESTKNIDTVYMSKAAFNSAFPKDMVKEAGEYSPLKFDEKDNLLLF